MRIRQKTILTSIGKKLAGAVDTLVFLMGVGRTQHIAEELIRYGKSADTPAAFVRWGTRPYQETYTTTLGEAAEAVKKYGIKPPSVFIVGNVVNLREQLRWYDNKPLFGKACGHYPFPHAGFPADGSAGRLGGILYGDSIHQN